MRTTLESLIESTQHLTGPFVIIGRAHSGTRPAAFMFMQNGIYMGSKLVDNALDSEIWYRRFVVPLITSPSFPDFDACGDVPGMGLFCEARLKDTLEWFFAGEPPRTGAWGWKLSETLFLMPLLKRYFPGAKFIHVIRDGRDVALSDDGYFQLTSVPRTGGLALKRKMLKSLRLVANRHQRYAQRYSYTAFFKNITFGTSNLTHWQGIDLRDRDALTRNRFLIQMQSWRYCVETARQNSAKMPGDYMEVRYEDLCADPPREAEKIFAFLGLPLHDQTRHQLAAHINTARIGKWQTRQFEAYERADFEAALSHGAELLRALGYTE